MGGKDSGKGKLESTTVTAICYYLYLFGQGNFDLGKVGEFEKLMLVASMQGEHG